MTLDLAPVQHFVAVRTGILAQLLVSFLHMSSAVGFVRELLSTDSAAVASRGCLHKITHPC